MAISNFLDPKNDFVFWKIFGTEKNKDLLIAFLNHVLRLSEHQQVIDVTFLDPRQRPDIDVLRESIVDVLCVDQSGVQFIVEMQVSKHAGFEKRAQYYAAKAYSRQIITEDEDHKRMSVYAKLKGVIFLAIADFIMFPEKGDWLSEHHLVDKKTFENDLKDFYFVFMELPKFKKTLNELTDIQDKWMYFFKHAKRSTFEEIEQLIGEDTILKRAFFAIDQASWSVDDLAAYERREKNRIDSAMIESQKIFDAEQKGMEKGMVRGKEEERANTVRNLLKLGVSIQTISEATGLNEEQVNQLRDLP